MSEQEKENLDEEVNQEAQADQEDAAETEAVEETEEQDAEKLAAELEDLNQRFLRVAADFENYKRRTAQEKDDLLK